MSSELPLTYHDKQMLQDGFQFSKSFTKKRKYLYRKNASVSTVNQRFVRQEVRTTNDDAEKMNSSSFPLIDILKDEYKKYEFDIEHFEKKIRTYRILLKKESNISLLFTNDILKKMVPFEKPQREIKSHKISKNKKSKSPNVVKDSVNNEAEKDIKEQLGSKVVVDSSNIVDNTEKNSNLTILSKATKDEAPDDSGSTKVQSNQTSKQKLYNKKSNDSGEGCFVLHSGDPESRVHSKVPKSMYIYGIGDLRSDASIFQFACTLSILSSACGNTITRVYLYDPILYILFTDESLTILKSHFKSKYNVDILEKNDECINTIEEACIVFMPHCPKMLYYNLLKSNWKTMEHFILVGNVLPLPSSVVDFEWNFSNQFPTFSRHDLSHYGLNDTSIYLMKPGTGEDFEKFVSSYQIDKSCYITKEMCA